MIQIKIISCLLLVLACVLSGCTSDEPQQTDQDSGGQGQMLENVKKEAQPDFIPKNDGSVKPDFGGRIVRGIIGDATNLIYPLASDQTSHTVADLLFVAPLKYDKDLNIIPWAAKSYEVLEHGKRLRFELRKGITWDDGFELTTADVEFTYQLMVDPSTPTAYAEDFLAIKEFKIIDRYVFEVVYEYPMARSLITWMSGILPKHALENENLLDTTQSRKPISAGPFRVKEWIAGRHIILEARDDYFEGRPYLDEVVFRIIPDRSTMFLELKAGNLDFMELTPEQYLFQTKGPFWQENFRKFKYLAFSYIYLGYNLALPMFQDDKVRLALAHAINKDEIVKGAFLGQGMPVIGPYKPGTWVYNDQIEDYAFDPKKARSLLAEAGWEDTNKDGILDKDGVPFAFTILTNQGNEQRIKAGTIIQSRLKDVGINVDVRTVEWAAFLNEFINKKQFETVILGWNVLQDPDIFDVWHSSKREKGGLNFVSYANTEADALLERGRRVLDQGERRKIYFRFQELLHQEQPYCFLAAPYALPIVHARFQNVKFAPSGIEHNFIKWWVPKALQKYRDKPDKNKG